MICLLLWKNSFKGEIIINNNNPAVVVKVNKKVFFLNQIFYFHGNFTKFVYIYFPDLTPEAAKRRLNQTRPQSAFIPRSRPSSSSQGSSAQVEQGQVGLPTSPRSSTDIRRRSDFVSRYESLLNRCQAATKAVDELDLLRLQKAANQSGGSQDADHLVDADAIEDNDEEEIADVDFDEEEVLQKCQEFQKDYQERKSQKQQPSAATVSINLPKSTLFRVVLWLKGLKNQF